MPEVNSFPKSTEQGYTISNYKSICHCCKQYIDRGNEITRCVEYGGHYSMTLRPRTIKKCGGFYTPDTGARWVHKKCKPSVWTDWSALCYTNMMNDSLKDVNINYDNWDNWEDGYDNGFPDDYLGEWDIY